MELMRRVRDPDKLRRAGLSEDEIFELVTAQKELASSDLELQAKMIEEIEYGGLLRKESDGKLSEKESEELNRKMGVFFTFQICGKMIRVNHCLVARLVIALLVLGAALHVTYLAYSYDGGASSVKGAPETQ